jgi:hypothetical protein
MQMGYPTAFIQAPHRFRDLLKCDVYGVRSLYFHNKMLPFFGAESRGACPFVGSNTLFRFDLQ